ncbi:sodium/proline symporter PutP [Aquisalibacillus elongatus]|uniref:Sodium/proline symporter n=1 Tax=Aquisalibacillus elongatus TaxID=485577 RepID=A0A3N5B0B6_9BACI|nr:sodium/proline symporter PutP [Aquisalibacillus elongatus]RPF50653.1 sodium/proline symporter [Aquisalibacillus elongatus]
MDTATLVTFLIYIVGMLVLGVIGYRLTSNLSDYFLGGRKLGPGVTALSAGASDMSSWLILGLPGAIYVSGLGSAWIAVGLTVGAYLNWQFVAKRLRIYTEVSNNAITIPDFFENRFRDRTKALRIASAAVILLFFTFYTASGLVGGATLFSSSFGLSENAALIIGSIVIIGYTFLGGFIAVSWTDFIQGILMFLALIILPIIAIQSAGGFQETINVVGSMSDGSNLEMIQGVGSIGIISSLAWGLGYFGQPHILVRFMAIRSHKDVPTARFVGMGWMVLSLFGAIAVGISGYAYIATADVSAALAERGIAVEGGVLGNEETVFIALTQLLTHPVVAGVLLAAILAAIMSTIDSQLLVSSSAFAEDFYKGLLRKNASNNELVWVARISVVIIAILAIIIAKSSDGLVLELVEFAWGGFGSAFGPVILLALFWKRLTALGAFLGIITGAVTAVVWRYVVIENDYFGDIGQVYELVPGFILAGLVAIIFSLISRKPTDEVEEEFDQVRDIANS